MTRKEEIEQASKLVFKIRLCPRTAFIRGAEWADRNPRKRLWDAEKVCKWLSDRVGIDQKVETNSNGEPLADSYVAYCIARKDAADAIIKELRKAMED